MSGDNNPSKRPEIRRKILKALYAGPNKAEQALQRILDRWFPGEWKFVGNGDLILGGKCPDFMNVNGKKMLIELYGDFWHRNDDPVIRCKVFEPYGYETIVIWEHELKSENLIVQKINKDFRSLVPHV